MNHQPQRDNSGVIAPPPLIFLATFLLGLGLHLISPRAFIPGNFTFVVGAPFILLGLFLGFAAIVTMVRAHTSPDPGEPTQAIVTHGPFRFTRNPIYLAFALIYFGVCAAFNALAPLVLLPLAIVVTHYVIAREERYLAQKFGEAYLRYKQSVRRWI